MDDVRLTIEHTKIERQHRQHEHDEQNPEYPVGWHGLILRGKAISRYENRVPSL
jgi:hypothetical protein